MFDGLIRKWWTLLYNLTKMIAWLLGLLYDFFSKAVGLDTVDYGGKKMTLLNVIFRNSVVSRAYWTMAIIGIGLCFFFTILAVIRKIFDDTDEVKSSLGQMLTQSLKSIILICTMSLIMSLALSFTASLMQGVQIAFFSNTQEPTESDPKTFSKTEYATMARVMNTIGNYSLNPSYDSRYNINSCYNAIRADLAKLKSEGTFGVRYETPDVINNKSHYWQEALQKIVIAAPSLDEDVTMDEYNKALATAIEDVMDNLRNNKQFQPLKEYACSSTADDSANIELDRVALLVGTLDASYDADYNGNKASIKDMLRSPFYYNTADHDLYDTDTMWSFFDLSEYHYVFVLFMILIMIWDMAGILLTTIARIFNMAVLFIVSPPFIAMSPLDNGAKFKQWKTSFMIQCFNVFGTLVAIDLIVTFIPIVMSNDLQIFDNTIANYLAKLVIIWGGLSAAKKAANLVNGILGENAGMTSADSLKMDGAAGAMTGVIGSAAGFAGSAAGWMTGAKFLKMGAELTGQNFKDRFRDKLPFHAKREQKSEKMGPQEAFDKLKEMGYGDLGGLNDDGGGGDKNKPVPSKFAGNDHLDKDSE